MTVNLDQILKYCNYLVNKDQVADAISPDEYNTILPIVNSEIFASELNKINRRFGQPFIDSYRDSYLRDCEVVRTYTPLSDTMALPDDYERFIAGRARVVKDWYEINFTDTLDAFSPLDGISATNNLVTINYGNSLKFNKVVNEVQMIYIAEPTAPYYGYTTANFEAVYDPSTSVQFVWGDSLLPRVVNLIFEKMGINIKDQTDIQVSQIKKQDEKR